MPGITAFSQTDDRQSRSTLERFLLALHTTMLIDLRIIIRLWWCIKLFQYYYSGPLLNLAGCIINFIMSGTLLATKFYIPRKHEINVTRPHLVEKIIAGVSHPGSIVLVSGPAGFGKTTLIGEFVTQYAGAVAWLSLDEEENDPIRFWTYLIKALQTVKEDLGASALSLFDMPQLPPAESIASILINDLVRLDIDLILVLDDLHLVQNEEIHRTISYLIDHIPEKFHLLVSTRIDPPWPLPRLRARSQLVEIRASHLRFSYEEAAIFLRQLLGFELSDKDVEALEVRTEGWVAALQLAALSMQGRTDISGFIKSFTGSHLYIAEYLVEEVFKKQNAEMRKFLLETSILGRLNADLSVAVTRCENGQKMLQSLSRANLFIVSLDDEGNWYRYHHLFADLLRARLRKEFSETAIK